MDQWLGDKVRDCMHLLLPGAFIATVEGRYDEAMKNYLALLQLSEMLNRDPMYSSQFWALQTTNFVYRDLTKHVAGENVAPEIIMDIIGTVKDMGQRDVFADSFKISVQRASEIFDKMRRGERFEDQYEPYSLESFLSHIHGTILGQPFIVMDESTCLDIMDRASNLARLPYYEARPLLIQLDEEVNSLSRTNIISRALTPHFIQDMARGRAAYDAQLGLMQVGLAVELHHSQHGVYPETLDEISPTLNSEIPLDPYTGEPFVYEPGQDGFTLFSQGRIENVYWRQKEKSSHH